MKAIGGMRNIRRITSKKSILPVNPVGRLYRIDSSVLIGSLNRYLDR